MNKRVVTFGEIMLRLAPNGRNAHKIRYCKGRGIF